MPIEDDYNKLKNTINDQWARLYGRDDVDTIYKLNNRIIYFAEDRNCWVYNAKQADAEAKKLFNLCKK